MIKLNMKQLKVILLLLLFIHSKMGMTLNFHYCGDHLAEISFAFNPKGCGMESSKLETSNTLNFSQKSCCSDDLQVYQSMEDITILDDAQAVSIDAEVLVYQNTYTDLAILSAQQVKLKSRPPPGRSNLFLLYSSFVFYG